MPDNLYGNKLGKFNIKIICKVENIKRLGDWRNNLSDLNWRVPGWALDPTNVMSQVQLGFRLRHKQESGANLTKLLISYFQKNVLYV